MKSLLFTLLILLCAASAEARTFWASSTATSTNCVNSTTDPGPSGYSTIRGALGLCVGLGAGLGAGDTVIVKNGTYTENLDQASIGDWLPKGSGTSWANANVFTLKAEVRATNGGTARLDGGSNRLLRLCPAPGTNFFAVIEGFLFDFSSWNSSETPINFSCSDSGANYVRFQYNDVRNAPNNNMLYFGAGSHINSGLVTTLQDGNNIDVFYNKFHGGDMGGPAGCCGYPIYANGYFHRFVGNEFYNFPAYAIHANNQASDISSGGEVDEWLIDGNYFHNWHDQRNDGGFVNTPFPPPAIIFNDVGKPFFPRPVIGQPPPTGHNSVGVKIINNVFSQGPFAVELRHGPINSIIANNTAYGMNGPDTGGSPPSGRVMMAYSQTTVKNNIFYNSNQPYVGPTAYYGGWTFDAGLVSNNFCETTNSQSGCIGTTGNPLFASGSGANAFKLQSGSPAINAGVDVSANIGCIAGSTCVDYAGAVRPQGGAWDIGAFEFGGGVVTPPTVAISRPTSPNCVGTASACTISGVAGNPNNTLNLTGTSTQSGGAVTWACDRCTGTNTASGTLTWTTAQITLKPGLNNITVTHVNANGTSNDTITITYVPTFPGNARVLAFGFEDGAGTTATDSSGNANTGTLVGTPTWLANGRYGKALTFNGTNQYVRVPRTNNTLELSQSFTLSAWVNPAASIPRFQAVIHKNSAADVGGPASPYDMYANITGFCGDSGFMGLVTVNGIQTPSQRFSACSAAPLQANNWTHIAVTYDNAAAQLKLYRNGALIITMAAAGYMENSNLELFIGTSEFGEYFAGSIDEVRVYNFAIPLAGALNATVTSPCNSTEANTAATASIIGDMNCPVVSLAPPIAFKIGAASSLKLGADKQLQIGGVPQ